MLVKVKILPEEYKVLDKVSAMKIVLEAQSFSVHAVNKLYKKNCLIKLDIQKI